MQKLSTLLNNINKYYKSSHFDWIKTGQSKQAEIEKLLNQFNAMRKNFNHLMMYNALTGELKKQDYEKIKELIESYKKSKLSTTNTVDIPIIKNLDKILTVIDPKKYPSETFSLEGEGVEELEDEEAEIKTSAVDINSLIKNEFQNAKDINIKNYLGKLKNFDFLNIKNVQNFIKRLIICTRIIDKFISDPNNHGAVIMVSGILEDLKRSLKEELDEVDDEMPDGETKNNVSRSLNYLLSSLNKNFDKSFIPVIEAYSKKPFKKEESERIIGEVIDLANYQLGLEEGEDESEEDDQASNYFEEQANSIVGINVEEMSKDAAAKGGFINRTVQAGKDQIKLYEEQIKIYEDILKQTESKFQKEALKITDTDRKNLIYAISNINKIINYTKTKNALREKLIAQGEENTYFDKIAICEAKVDETTQILIEINQKIKEFEKRNENKTILSDSKEGKFLSGLMETKKKLIEEKQKALKEKENYTNLAKRNATGEEAVLVSTEDNLIKEKIVKAKFDMLLQPIKNKLRVNEYDAQRASIARKFKTTTIPEEQDKLKTTLELWAARKERAELLVSRDQTREKAIELYNELIGILSGAAKIETKEDVLRHSRRTLPLTEVFKQKDVPTIDIKWSEIKDIVEKIKEKIKEAKALIIPKEIIEKARAEDIKTNKAIVSIKNEITGEIEEMHVPSKTSVYGMIRFLEEGVATQSSEFRKKFKEFVPLILKECGKDIVEITKEGTIKRPANLEDLIKTTQTLTNNVSVTTNFFDKLSKAVGERYIRREFLEKQESGYAKNIEEIIKKKEVEHAAVKSLRLERLERAIKESAPDIENNIRNTIEESYSKIREQIRNILLEEYKNILTQHNKVFKTMSDIEDLSHAPYLLDYKISYSKGDKDYNFQFEPLSKETTGPETVSYIKNIINDCKKNQSDFDAMQKAEPIKITLQIETKILNRQFGKYQSDKKSGLQLSIQRVIDSLNYRLLNFNKGQK